MSSVPSVSSVVLGLLAAAALIGCDDYGKPTGATCPPGSTLTYDNFARPFMEKYCTDCHSSERHGDDRHGAPIYHDFDTESGILNVGGHVDQKAAAGPDAINTLMPPDDGCEPDEGPCEQPTEAERRQLGEWLACFDAEP